jgi:alkylation response protein AidB-like acyl-CoA dehydrogenase
MTTDAKTSDPSGAPGIWPDYPTLLPKPLSEREVRLLSRAREHAVDFATRADQHDREATFPSENYAAMKASGYAHMTLPERLGGEDVTLLELCACQEQLAQGCAGTTVGVNMHIFGLGAMLRDAEQAPPERRAQTEMILNMVAAGKSILSGSFSETGQAGAYFLPATKATRADGGWKVNGVKSYNSNFPAADMVAALVHVVDHPEGGSMVAMVGMPKATPGVTGLGAESWDVLGVRASGSYDVQFSDVFVPDAMMPPAAPADDALFTQMTAFLAWFNVSISAVYLGVAQAATDWSIAYLKDRRPPTEERPLAYMPGMQYQLAEMVALNEASRALIRSSAQDWEAKPWGAEETAEKGGICKYITTNQHLRVVNLAMDIAGGPGLFRRFGLERLYRDVRAAKAHPPSDVMALEQIAKRVLGIPRDFTPRWG